MTAPSFHEEEVLGKAYDARLMRRLLTYVRPYRGLVAASVTLLMIDGALQLVGPMLTRRVIDVAIPGHDTAMILRAAILFAGALAAQFACSYGETLLTALLGQKVMRDLRLEIFTHLQRLSIAFFDRNPVGRLITRVTSDVESLNELFTAGVVAGMGDLFTLLAISVLILVVDWRLALSTFAVLPFVWIVSRRFQVSVRAAYRDIRVRLARINAFLQERLTGMRIVQLFGREAHEADAFDGLNRAHLDAHLRSITYYALYFPAIEFLTTVATASLIVSAAARVQAGVLTVGTVAAFLQLVRRFFQPLQDLSDKYNTLQQAMASSERVFRLLDTEPPGEAGRGKGEGERRNALGNPAGSAGREAGRGAGTSPSDASRPSRVPAPPPPVTVAFEHVWFAYEARGVAEGAAPAAEPAWVLRDVSFAARPGETVALVGHTGAGKTTIVSLLMRFYDPQRGRITINGRDVRDMAVEDVRALIGYVQQDIFLFAGDVAGNIRLSAPLTDAEVAAAAARVGADRVIRHFAGGYAHELGERGASISVGERQLLSFARAIAADPALLLLDEATSAVDSEIEAEIQAALQELMRGRTTIAVAHRLSTIVGADEILVLHHGEVVERGSHRALLAADGLYARLWRLQAGERADTRETSVAS
jgi:ATP-binding cassette, subfamily B, multidrug efflux pump